MYGGSRAVGAALTVREPIGRFFRHAAENDEFIADLQGDAVSREESGGGGNFGSGLEYGNQRLCFIYVRRQGEGPILTQTQIGYGRYVGRILGDKKCVGMQSGGDACFVQFIQDRLHAFPPLREEFGVGRVVAETQRRTGMEINLSESQLTREFNPVVHCLFGQRPEIEEIGPAIDGGLQRPRPADGRMGRVAMSGQLIRGGHHFFHDLAQFGHGRGHHRNGRAGDAETLISRGFQFARRTRNMRYAGLQVQGKGAGGKWLVKCACQTERHVEQR